MKNIKIWNILKKAPEKYRVPSDWEDNPTFIYCGRTMPREELRSSKFENSLVVTEKHFEKYHPDCIDIRKGAIHIYRHRFYVGLTDGKIFWNAVMNLIDIYKEHGRLDLVCWCAPLPCHCDVIKEYIENELNLRGIEL